MGMLCSLFSTLSGSHRRIVCVLTWSRRPLTACCVGTVSGQRSKLSPSELTITQLLLLLLLLLLPLLQLAWPWGCAHSRTQRRSIQPAAVHVPHVVMRRRWSAAHPPGHALALVLGAIG